MLPSLMSLLHMHSKREAHNCQKKKRLKDGKVYML